MPTTPVNTYSDDRLVPLYLVDGDPLPEIPVRLATGTYAKGQVLGEVTATPGTYKAYAAANSDGSQTARLICSYACTVDAGGNVTIGNEYGAPRKTVPALIGGVFKGTDLVGIDAAGLTQLGGRLIQGTLANGVVVIPV